MKNGEMQENEGGRLGYQEQDSPLTLREGLAEYHAANPGLVQPHNASTESMGDFFSNHDASHVVFGTTTSLRGEILQDTWSFLGMSVSLKKYVVDFLKSQEGKQIMKDVPLRSAIWELPWYSTKLPRIAWRAFRMKKKWPWKGWEPYLDTPLAEIRREFGIRVL